MIVKIICEILENFHFHTETCPDAEVPENDIALVISGKSFSLQKDIYETIRRKIIPNLESRVMDKSKQNPLRVPVVFAIIRLLKLLPSDDLHILLPKLFGIICNTLKDRDQVARDTARTTLVQVHRRPFSPSGFPSLLFSSPSRVFLLVPYISSFSSLLFFSILSEPFLFRL